MFHLKQHSKHSVAHSSLWREAFLGNAPQKRVIHPTHTSAYQPSLLAQSIHDACMKTLGFAGEAETTAIKVCQEVEDWLQDKEEVTSSDMRRIAAAALRKYNPPAAYEYLPNKEYESHEGDYGFIRL